MSGLRVTLDPGVDCTVVSESSPSLPEGRDGGRCTSRHVPERTCVGCRRKGPRHRLVRVVVSTDRSGLAVDPTATAPGRGAWIHPDERCLNLAIAKRAFARALRIDGPCDGEAIRTQVVHHQYHA